MVNSSTMECGHYDSSNVGNSRFVSKRTTPLCSASEHGALFPKQQSGFVSVEDGRLKAESVEGAMDVGGIESAVSIHPSVFDILRASDLN